MSRNVSNDAPTLFSEPSLWDESQDPFDERYDESADSRCTLAVAQGRPRSEAADPSFRCTLGECPYYLGECF